MKAFQITAHNGARFVRYSAIAACSVDAAIDAADLFGEEPCSITVTPLQVAK
jgi:hypothetical protein